MVLLLNLPVVSETSFFDALPVAPVVGALPAVFVETLPIASIALLIGILPVAFVVALPVALPVALVVIFLFDYFLFVKLAIVPVEFQFCLVFLLFFLAYPKSLVSLFGFLES